MKKTTTPAFLLLALTATLSAADPAPAPPPDLSSPDKTWAALCAAVKAQDLPALRACFYGNSDLARRFISVSTDLTITRFRLAQSAGLIMGAGGRQLSDQLMSFYTDMVASSQNRTTEFKDDAASWSRTDPHAAGNNVETLYFKKVNNQWLLDTTLSYNLDSSLGRKQAEDFIAASEPQITLLKKIISDIQANKIRSLEDLRQRLVQGDGTVR